MAQIDWTKPIQWSSTVLPEWIDATYIGKHGDLCVVCVRPPHIYHRFTNEGYPAGLDGLSLKPYIRNTPPPPVWPQKRWFVTLHTGSVSGPHLSYESARLATARIPSKYAFTIEEAEFYGPQS